MDNDEKTPGPAHDRDHLSAAPDEGTGAEAPSERFDAESEPAAAPAAPAEGERRGRRRTRNVLIGAGAAVALLAFGGGAYAIGSAVGDDDDEHSAAHAPAADGARGGQPAFDDDPDADDGDDSPDADGTGDAGAGASAPASAAALRSAAEAAIAHASAEGITSIEIERGGYDIDARSADGTEVELFVTPDGTVREHGDGDAETDDDPLIDLAKLGDILAAAQSAATDAGATETTFHALSTSTSGALYEVELRQGARDEVEVELDADLSTVRVDIDG